MSFFLTSIIFYILPYTAPNFTYLIIARIATAYYFLHFLIILPFLGKKEKTLDVPLNITEPVLGGYPNQAKTKEKLNIKENL